MHIYYICIDILLYLRTACKHFKICILLELNLEINNINRLQIFGQLFV